MSEVAAMLASLPDHDLRVYLCDHLCFWDEGADQIRFSPKRGVWKASLGLGAHRRMVEPGDATDCRDYEVLGASACSTEREALELWCAYFWSLPAEPTP